MRQQEHDERPRATSPARPLPGASAVPGPVAAALRLQRAAGNRAVAALLEHEAQVAVPTSGGQPLPAQVRGFMESRLGADLSSVRVHTDSAAAASARQLQASAYTAGEHVVFGRGAYRPDTPEGQHTLAHELTHVLQQRAGPVDGTPIGGGLQLSHPSDRFERAAEANARAVVQRGPTDDLPDDGAAGAQRLG